LRTLAFPWAASAGRRCTLLAHIRWHAGLGGGPSGGGAARQTSKSQSLTYLGMPTLGGAKSGGRNGRGEAAAA
jgi:hypothetical protein